MIHCGLKMRGWNIILLPDRAVFLVVLADHQHRTEFHFRLQISNPKTGVFTGEIKRVFLRDDTKSICSTLHHALLTAITPKRTFMKSTIAIGMAALVVLFTLVQCGNDNKPAGTGDSTLASVPFVIPVDLPTNIVPGFHFPQDSATILGWVSGSTFDTASICSHAWGIWAGLTAESGEVYQGDSLRVFETWLGISEIQSIISNVALNDTAKPDLKKSKTSRTKLAPPSQLGHNKQIAESPDDTFGIGSHLFVAVSYNNPAAAFAVSNSILKQDKLNTYYTANQIGTIPQFPNDAITIKPTFFVSKPTGNLIRIPVWPGEPSTPQGYSFSQWNNYIFADTTNSQQPGKALTPITGSDTAAADIAGATCNLSDFIYFEMDSSMAAAVNFSQSTQGANYSAGDLAVLVCMHVATKEISNWTWQTFYWDPNPSQPKFPGTNLSKPAQLSAPANHYSVSTAYAMLAPNQPVTGGNNNPTNGHVFGYNPYLEAGFTPQTFDSIPNAYNPDYAYGIQTNCMSCHAFANYSPNVSINNQGNNPLYSTDQYVDMNSPVFRSRVKLDFAWSIIANIVPSTTSSPNK